MPPFIHLRVHSAYSLAEGAIRVPDIPPLCHHHSMPAVAITDTNNMFGALEIAMACAKNGIQPITGCQLAIQLPNASRAPVVLLAQNEIGYKNLLSLVSEAHLHHEGDPFSSIEKICNNNEGLILLTGAEKGFLGTALGYDKAYGLQALKMLHGSFHDRLYIELQRHPEREESEAIFLDLAKNYTIPIVATNNVYFETPTLYEAHDVLLCIASGSYLSEEKRPRVSPHHYFKSGEEMAALFSDLPEAIYNTQLIARRCHFMPTEHPPILPKFSLSEGQTETEALNFLARKGLEKRLLEDVFPSLPEEEKKNLKEQYEKRLNYELSIIKQMGFSGYFLIVSDFIQWAKSKEIPVGPGRGSGAGSLVAWALTITDIDPIRFGLIFERFLNPERVSMPDFDIDFCQERRDEVIQYVCKKYGADKVAHIITFGKLQARAVLRDVGRVLQMPYGQVDKICKLIPNNPAHPVTLEQALAMEPLLRNLRETEEVIDKLIDIGLKLEGLYRHASTHAAGVVIADRPLKELVPLYKDERSHLPATQFSMKYVEAAGLLKFDFLGLKTLTIIEDCLKLIRKKGLNITSESIPLDDKKTFDLLSSVQVLGVFQLESGGMRDVLRKLKPDRFEDIISLVALFRPGPMDDIPRYLACKHGEEKVSYSHPLLEPILSPTYGVMVYQEQVMEIARVLAGYTLGAADLLRRAMGKKIKSEMDAQKSLFVKGAINKGVDELTAQKIFDQMAKFAGYGFNKSHAAPYALLSYQTAYLKANYPLEFFAAIMTHDINNTDKLNAYQQDIAAFGFSPLPPCINASEALFSVEGNGIRYALAAIKNVGLQAMESLVVERKKNGIYKNLRDFISRMNPSLINKRQLEYLIAAGALDSLNEKRYVLYENIDSILSYAQSAQREKESQQVSLFSSPIETKQEILLTKSANWDFFETLEKEFNALGFYFSAHPLDLYQKDLKALHITQSNDISPLKSDISMAGVILSKQERTSKNGQKFCFLRLSDKGGAYEVVFFNETYTRIRDQLETGRFVIVYVHARFEGDSYRLTGNDLQLLDQQIIKSSVSLQCSPSFDLKKFKEVIDGFNPGSSKIELLINFPNHLHHAILCTLPTAYHISGKEKSLLSSIEGVRLK